MNKNNLLKNHSSSINVGALKRSMSKKRVLVVHNEIPDISYTALRPYFDVCIAVDEVAGSWSKTPDIFIATRLNPHVGSILDMRIYSIFNNSLLCITQSELDVIKAVSKYHSSHVLSWMPLDDGPTAEFSIKNNIPFGLSKDNPGVHLAFASGATEVYASSIQKDEFNKSLYDLITEKNGYIPKNILRPVRPQFIDEVVFS